MAMVNFRLDDDIKKGMEKTCKELGMSMTTAFTVFATKVSREQRIPFELSVNPLYSDTNLQFLRDSLAQLERAHPTGHAPLEDNN